MLFVAPYILNSLSGRLSRKNIEVFVRSTDIYSLSVEQKSEDADFLFKVLEENYPLFDILKIKYNYDWLSDKTKFREWIVNSNTPQEYYEAVNRILTSLQDKHTKIIEPRYFNEYVKLYGSHSNNVWSAILSNNLVKEKYAEWSKIINDKKYMVPAAFKYVEGKYAFIKEIDKGVLTKHGIPLGSELTAVNNESIDQYLRKNKDIYHLEIDYTRKKAVADDLVLLSNGPDMLNLSFRTPRGENIEKSVQAILIDTSVNTNKNNYSTQIIRENEIAYAKFSSFQAERVLRDNRVLSEFFQKVKHYPYLIIDIRGNSGGNVAYWKENIVNLVSDKIMRAEYYVGYRNSEYMEKIADTKNGDSEKPDIKLNNYLLENDFNFKKRELKLTGVVNNTGFKGHIYLLTDRKVYSAAEYLAYFAKKTSWAALVGTETGGGMNSEPMAFVLPNSGLIISFTGGIGISNDGIPNSMNGTLPDIYAEQSYSDLLKELQQDGRILENTVNPHDTVLNTVINILDK